MSSVTPQKVYLKQSSFAGGEVAPAMWGRDDYKKYESSAKTMYNFFPHPIGGASNRPGTYLVEEVKNSAKKVKLLPFQFSVEQAYITEAGENYFRYYKDGGQIVRTVAITDAWALATAYVVDDAVDNGGLVYRCISAHTSAAGDEPGVGATWATKWVQSAIVETTTTYAESKLFGLKTAQSADTMYISHNDYTPSTLTRSSHYKWTFGAFDYKNGPFRTPNSTATTITPSATTGNITLTASTSIFDSDHVGSLWQISHDVTGQVVNITFSSTTNSSSIKCKGDWSLVTHGTWTGTLTLQKSTDGGSTWYTIRSYTSTNDANVEDSGETDELVLLRLGYTHTGGSCGVDLNAHSFVMDGVVDITGYTSGTVVNATVINELAYNTATKDWAEGSWSTKNGFPACVKFYQNRVGFAGSVTDPLTLWLSKVGDYPNFLSSVPVKDDDAITAPLVSQGVNSIRSIVSIGNLLAFTAGGEWKIGTGSESTALTPTSTRAVQQGYRGTSTLEPLIIGDRILYCQEMGSTVRDFGYSLTDDVYKGDDLTMLARHLFRNYEIVDWAYQQEPDGIIWAVRDDGILLSFTYIKEQDVWGWAQHETDGYFESVAAIPGADYTEVYFVVRRTIGGATKRFIERLAPRMVSTDPRDQFFVDCGLTYDGVYKADGTTKRIITGATKASPVVITSTAHELNNGDYVDISDVTGMTELNGNRYKVANKTADTFELTNMDDDTDIDGTAFTTFISGGYIRKAVITVSGLSHLEGETVTILADGTVDASQAVSSGSITLTDYASRVHVGLGYTSDLETLNLDFPMKDGTIQGRMKCVRRVTPRLEKSYGGYVGINGSDNLEPIEYALSDTWGKPADLFTGDVKTTPFSAFNTDATIFIRQSDPLPITVLCLMAEVELGGDQNGNEG
jgi:hypothetical protein